MALLSPSSRKGYCWSDKCLHGKCTREQQFPKGHPESIFLSTFFSSQFLIKSTDSSISVSNTSIEGGFDMQTEN